MIQRFLFSIASGAALAAVSGCGGSSLGECPPGSEAQQATGSQIVATQCASCHSSQLSGAARAGAPESYNFDSPDGVRANAELMFEQAESGAMPKTGPLSSSDVENLRVYLACSAQ